MDVPELSAGSKAVALRFRDPPAEVMKLAVDETMVWRDDRLVLDQASEPGSGRLRLVEQLLERLRA